MLSPRRGQPRPDRPTTTAYGRELFTSRHRAGKSQHDLAQESGVSRSTIQNLERGQVARPRRDTHALLAQALGPYLAMDDLVQLDAVYRAACRRWFQAACTSRGRLGHGDR